jgi:hypothetical protein
MVVKGGDDLLTGASGLAGIIVLIFVNIGFVVYEGQLATEFHRKTRKHSV